jgi:hypothetical protein
LDAITIEYGFLQLTDVVSKRSVSVKGSAITCITTLPTGNTWITYGDSGRFFIVLEKREPILHAVAESYKQAARR